VKYNKLGNFFNLSSKLCLIINLLLDLFNILSRGESEGSTQRDLSSPNFIKELKLKISKKYQERKEEIARLLAEDEEAERAEEESVEEPVVEEE